MEHWAEALRDEVGKIKPAIRILEGNDVLLVGSKHVDFMVVFDVKMVSPARHEYVLGVTRLTHLLH